MRMNIAFAAWLWLSAGGAAAQTPAPEAPGAAFGSDLSSGYCDWVQGTSDAETALMFAPEVFASVGVVNAGEAEGGTSSNPLGKPKARVTAGLDYDLMGIYRGLTLRRRAEAECRRYRALATLQAAALQGSTLCESAALEARARSLETSLPRAEALLASLRNDLRDGNATLEELNAVQVRLDGLRSLASDTARALDRLAVVPPEPMGRSLSALLAEYEAADDAVESIVGGLRRADAWQLDLRGGYDQVFETTQDVPLFGQLTLSYNLGHLWQGSANARARQGRRRSEKDAVEGTPRRIQATLAELRALRDTETARLREVTALVSDLEAQLSEVRRLETRQVRRFRDYLELELSRLRAEQAYVGTHLASLEALLKTEGP
ncbi:hypothetical protein DRW03_29145 [Corallococcus sp. H22C18031201]|uniref:hypothetical protein n=1 Tax=Citreicoccus inhibens TaxID=2849499 RepID=UPI000E722B1F|nr:hypothetical protein [Citreicoccus inhibens]MBU8897481.1 hypothetical protein [Citreicoccus inhibens]RJS16746.1 hypothetical protein DRW03_29145 [Corallococcus sp. H22C18031201]